MKSLLLSLPDKPGKFPSDNLFSAMLAHEIRNPMWTIRTFASLLPKRMFDRTFMESFCRIVPHEAERLTALIEQLIDPSRQHSTTRRLINVHEVIEIAAKIFASRAEAAQVRIETHSRARRSNIWADGSVLQQVFNNLLENSIDALRRTPGPRQINIRTHIKSKMLVVEVEDNGPGIPLHVWPHLFCPFATFAKSGGTGLGLFIVARIVRAQGGTVRAVKQRGAGALFKLQFPLARVSRINARGLTSSAAQTVP